jgi:hypothetical protein
MKKESRGGRLRENEMGENEEIRKCKGEEVNEAEGR